MSDLVERLRKESEMQFSLLLLEEAADRIEALENALQNLARAVQFKVSATLAPEQDK